MATETGAKALGFDNTGVLKEGYAADLTIMDMKYPSLQPVNDPVAAMCYSASGYEVESVMVDGEDPDTCEVQTGGCSGSCSTCGGCH